MKLKLNKALSYSGYGVSVKKEAPFVVVEDAQQIAALLSSGYFVEATEDAKLPEPTTTTRPISTLDTKTKAELFEIANERGVKLTGRESKAKLLDLIAATGPINDEHTEASADVNLFMDGIEKSEG